jgi:TIR domain/HEAT repeats
MSHVFVSYVRENAAEIARLCDDLSLAGVEVWLDRNSIAPGMRWKAAIRQAIERGAFFLACFSAEYASKKSSYMDEELLVAAKVRLRSPNRTWFIPIKLSRCEVPDRNIGGGERLSDLQWVELYPDWEAGMSRILDVIEPLPPGLATLVESLRSPFTEARAHAAEQLYRSPDPKALPSLLKALSDPEGSVTYWVVKALAATRHPRAVEALVAALDDPHWRGPQYKLAEEVARIDNPECQKAVREHNEREADWNKKVEWLARVRPHNHGLEPTR